MLAHGRRAAILATPSATLAQRAHRMAALSKPKARRMGWWSANASPTGLEHNGTNPKSNHSFETSQPISGEESITPVPRDPWLHQRLWKTEKKRGSERVNNCTKAESVMRSPISDRERQATTPSV
jgi:hypothetical protein